MKTLRNRVTLVLRIILVLPTLAPEEKRFLSVQNGNKKIFSYYAVLSQKPPIFDLEPAYWYYGGMEILSKLLGTEERVKIMRLFLLNAEMAFDAPDIRERSKVSKNALRREITLLSKIGFVKPKNFVKEIHRANGKKTKIIKKKVSGWQLAIDFPLLLPVRNLLISAEPIKHEDIIARFKPAGKVKLIVLAGVFLQKEDSRVDILIVGDELKKKSIENGLRAIEAEVGKELSYALFDTQDFIYRMNVYDKFARDILDFPHEKVYDKIGIF